MARFIRFFFLPCLVAALFFSQKTAAQQQFTLDDTLRGTITAERAWWDLTYYDLSVRVDPVAKSISGTNIIRYRVLQPGQALQIDLQPPLGIERVEQDGQPLTVRQIGTNAYLVDLKKEQTPGAIESLSVAYSGKPRTARRAPWDGGFSWSKDEQGRPFVATSCQGLGASVWWPCKDHAYDEPDSQRISITVPEPLMDVSNGRLQAVTDNGDSTRTYVWKVTNPINNYGVNLNIAVYETFADTFQGERGVLTLDYFVLSENLDKAKVQFQQVKGMLRAFEHWFGPYPFYEDGYKLVEVPYLGMEHQSSITYGNRYANGYLGRDLSGTGWGKKWDFIIIHESGHEWFANNVTYRDIADMWIHESFTNYSEGLYTEYHFGKKAGAEYIRGTRSGIQNKQPIVGTYGVNSEGSGDMYPKGGNMLHTIRQIVNDDEKWRSILRGINRDFFHQTVDGAQIEAYISQHAGKNLQKTFDQYLRQANLPVLEYRVEKGKLDYRWADCVTGFDMPVRVTLAPDRFEFVYPTTQWQTAKTKGLKAKHFRVDENFYVLTREVE